MSACSYVSDLAVPATWAKSVLSNGLGLEVVVA
jgi:hypothetical protein